MIISLECAASRPGVRLITANYDAGRVIDCLPDEVSCGEIARVQPSLRFRVFTGSSKRPANFQ